MLYQPTPSKGPNEQPSSQSPAFATPTMTSGRRCLIGNLFVDWLTIASSKVGVVEFNWGWSGLCHIQRTLSLETSNLLHVQRSGTHQPIKGRQADVTDLICACHSVIPGIVPRVPRSSLTAPW